MDRITGGAILGGFSPPSPPPPCSTAYDYHTVVLAEYLWSLTQLKMTTLFYFTPKPTHIKQLQVYGKCVTACFLCIVRSIVNAETYLSIDFQ